MVTVDDSSLVPAFANFSISESSAQAAPEAASEAPKIPAAVSEAPKVPAVPAHRQIPVDSVDRVFASPLARKLLRESGKAVLHP